MHWHCTYYLKAGLSCIALELDIVERADDLDVCLDAIRVLAVEALLRRPVKYNKLLKKHA